MPTVVLEKTFTVDKERVEALTELFTSIIEGQRCIEVVHAFAFALLRSEAVQLSKRSDA